MSRSAAIWALAIALLAAACSSDSAPVCEIVDETPDWLDRVGCDADFYAIGSLPLDSTIPGARSAKIVLDRSDDGRLYFQNSQKYAIHWEFATEHLSGAGKQIVGSLSDFNETEYYSPDRRFILGALTRYEGPGLWVFELSPYDTASADMIATAYRAIVASSHFRGDLRFHPTSEAIERVAAGLPEDVRVVTTDEIFAGIEYQPLNLAESYGRLRFMAADQLATDYVGFREIIVLDDVPNDISVVAGIITEAFQTPLSHINVLSQNRGTPNMALKGATTNEALRALDGKWVKFDVNAFEWQVTEVSQAEAEAWWEEHRPPAVQIPAMDLSRTELTDMATMLNPELGQRQRISEAVPAFGGKASHYAELATVPGVPVPRAFAIPLYHYDTFMTQHGFKDRVGALLADPSFRDDPATRDKELRLLREAMKQAPVDPDLLASIEAKLTADYPGIRMRFRSSTNAEDLDGFTGAGLYTSKSGAIGDPERPIEDAIRKVWASVWFFRAFEERSFRSISHLDVGMALLVHRSFPDEYANGVAVTANLFDSSGLEPALYINVQRGEASVVKPEPGVTTDEILYQFNRPGQPATYLRRSNQVPDGGTVLSASELYTLGQSLDAIQRHFSESYGPPPDDPLRWYGMDVEFKFDVLEPGTAPALQVKQARPHPGRGQ